MSKCHKFYLPVSYLPIQIDRYQLGSNVATLSMCLFLPPLCLYMYMYTYIDIYAHICIDMSMCLYSLIWICIYHVRDTFLPKYKKLHTYFHLYCKDFIQIAFQF